MVSRNISEREKKVLHMVIDSPEASVSDMSRALDVSAVTIRSTLNSLAEKGLVVRTWGGAMPAFHPTIVDRQRAFTLEKNRIAQAAAELVQDQETLMIEAGTTTALLAQNLLGKRGLRVVSNSTLVLSAMRTNPQISCCLVGGDFSPVTESLVGPIALGYLRQFHVSTAFVGTDGFSIDGGLSTHLVDGAEVVRTMSKQADRTVVLADSSKYDKRGFVHVLPLEEIDILITDTGLPERVAEEIAALGVEVRRV